MRLFYDFSLLLVLLLPAALGLSGCSPSHKVVHQPQIAVSSALSDEARAIQAYLNYLDLSGEKARQALNTAIELDPTPELFLEKSISSGKPKITARQKKQPDKVSAFLRGILC